MHKQDSKAQIIISLLMKSYIITLCHAFNSSILRYCYFLYLKYLVKYSYELCEDERIYIYFYYSLLLLGTSNV